MENKNINIRLKHLNKKEQKEINGGSELSDAIWKALSYVAGVTAKVHEYHAETAPWTGHAK